MNNKWRDKDVPLGFTFHKFFPGFGWFKGEVVKIRMGAKHYRTRRIRYEDGDIEDLSIREIQRAVFSYNAYMRKMTNTKDTSSSKRNAHVESLSESAGTKKRRLKKRKTTSVAKEESDQCDMSSIPLSFICLDDSDVESQITQEQPHSRRESLSTETTAKLNSLDLKVTNSNFTPRKSNITLQEESHQSMMSLSLAPSQDTSVTHSQNETVSRSRRTKKVAKRKNVESKDAPQLEKPSCVKLRIRDTPEGYEPTFGDVGFELYKFFPKHGWCKGMVIYVHPGKYAVRRVAYEHGVEEEVCLSELQELTRRYENYRSKPPVHDKGQHNPQNKIDGRDEKTEFQPVSASSAELNEAFISSEFDNLENFVPMDSVAESTLLSNTSKKNDEDSILSDENWLVEVASQLQTKSRKSIRKSQTITLDCDIKNDISGKHLYSPNEENALIPMLLTNVQRGKRHGCKVVDMNDPNRIVGQVLLELDNGWLEINVGSGVSKKARVSNFIVVPKSYKVGDVGPRIDIIKCKTITNKNRRDNTQTTDDGTNEKVPFHDVIYWFCCECEKRIDFDVIRCPSCQRSKMESSSVSSALLEIAENVCIAHDDQDTLPLIPSLYKKCIPHEVLSKVQKALQGRNNESTGEFVFYYDLDSLFYWHCDKCTMSNSFHRWSCLACKNKRCNVSALSPLLLLAFEFSKDKEQVEDAIRNIPIEHKSAIPEVIMKSLVTCVAVAKQTKCRCRCPKLPGSDFCANHQPTLHISSELGTKEEKSESIEFDEQNEGCNPFVGVEYTRTDLKSALRGLFPKRDNPRDWQIKCIEDVFICERNEPFPLGLCVRRYFAGYGWHDGFITIISRRDVIDNSEGTARPVLIYRVEYNDGDQEDLLHHEVNSLRQLYDVGSVRSTASAHEQIKVGTEFETIIGKMKVMQLNVDIDDAKDKGTVYVEIETANEPPNQTIIELLKLERLVIKLITPYSRCRKKLPSWLFEDRDNCRDKNQLPFIEWPPYQSNEKEGLLLNSTVRLHYSKCDDPNSDRGRVVADEMNRSSGYDPSGVLNYVSYNPFESVSCQVCHDATDDHYLLICDECYRGYHTYCLRPVVVNIPREIWLCPKCKPDESTLSSYEDIFKEFMKNSEETLSFLKINMKSSEEYYSKHKDSFEVLNCRNKWAETIGKKKTIMQKVGDFYVTRHKDRHSFKLPEPIQDPVLWTRSLASIAAAAKYCGMEGYTETLVYESKVSESMNDASLENVQGLSKVNLDLFQKFKSNLKVGIYPPVEVVYDMNIGFLVKALMKIPKHTIITEYIGEVNTVIEGRNSNSDSLMSLLLTGDDSTSLIIDPSRVGNMARFFSGINNKHYMSKKHANMRTRRFALDGKCRVVLFTCKDVMEGDILHYDYNAGVEGKSVDEMIQTGFYDTSNFL